MPGRSHGSYRSARVLGVHPLLHRLIRNLDLKDIKEQVRPQPASAASLPSSQACVLIQCAMATDTVDLRQGKPQQRGRIQGRSCSTATCR